MSAYDDRGGAARLVEQVARTAGERAAQRLASTMLAKAGLVVNAKLAAVVMAVTAAVLLLVFVVALVVGAVGAAFQSSTAPWPVSVDIKDDGTYRAGGWAISSRFGWRTSPLTHQAEFHDGIDVVSSTGACPFGHRCGLPSMFDGVVEYVGWDQTGADDPATMGGGQMVIVENGQEDHKVTYAHLEPYRLYVQLQGKIEDDYGRYDDEAGYRAVGDGELTPDLRDGGIELWCALDMPGFRPTRTGPGTVVFEYDRPAQCRTSVVWGEKGEGWEGWIADDPPADVSGRASLSWQTPIERGTRAGDIALRFRAHLVPPPPPPTALPTPGTPEPVAGATAEGSRRAPQSWAAERDMSSDGQGGLGQGWNDTREGVRSGQPVGCEREASGVRCVWRFADIPTASERASSLSPAAAERAGAGRVAARAASFQQALTPTPVAPRTPLLALVTTASRTSLPTGGRFSVAVSIFSEGESVAVPVTVSGEGALVVRAASGASGSCSFSGAVAMCQATAGAGLPATIAVVFDVLPGNPNGSRLAITARGSEGGRLATSQVFIEIAPYTVTPGPWPPPSQAPTQTPLPTSEPRWPTPDPNATALPTAAPTAVPPGQGPGIGPVSCAPQTLVQLPNVVNAYGATDNTRLIAPAAAAFQEARLEIIVRTGQDPLARLADGLRAPEFRTDKPGVARMSWHMTGRAVDLDTGYPWRRVREGNYWRLYLGQVDITSLLARHGFTRIPDQSDSAEWWHYEYRVDGVSWASAMLQVYPLGRLAAAFPEVAWASVGCQRGDTGTAPGPLVSDPERCVAGAPSFRSAVEELAGCGPPIHAGDRVYQLDTLLGYVGMTGQTTGPHLHLGLQVKSYDGMYHQVDICTPEWLQGLTPPPDTSCWTAMADPLAFLPLAPPPQVEERAAAVVPGTTPTALIPEGAPYQLPPPNYPGSLSREPSPDAAPIGQYWSPFQDGGQYGGGDALAWLHDTTCEAWSGFPWCQN